MEEIDASEANSLFTDTILKDDDSSSSTRARRSSTVPAEGAFCTVTKPEKVGDGINSYVTYLITTKKADGSHRLTVRRYSDFDWLHSVLFDEFPSILIPPLPAKAVMNRFSPEFVEIRRRELERFMRRILSHPELSASKATIGFIESSETEFNEVKRSVNETISAAKKSLNAQPKVEEKESVGSFFSSMASKFASAVSDVATTVTGVVNAKEVDNWFVVRTDYTDQLEDTLNTVSLKVEEQSVKRKEAVATLVDYSRVASLLAECEAQTDKTIAAKFSKLSDTLNDVARCQNDLIQQEEESFVAVITDMHRLSQACQDLLENRARALERLQNAEEAVKKEADGKKTAILEKHLSEVEERFNEMSPKVKDELQTFDAVKAKEMRTALRSLVIHNMDHHLKVANIWKEFLSELGDDADNSQ